VAQHIPYDLRVAEQPPVEQEWLRKNGPCALARITAMPPEAAVETPRASAPMRHMSAYSHEPACLVLGDLLEIRHHLDPAIHHQKEK